MKLPYDLITAALAKRFDCAGIDAGPHDLVVGRPLLWAPDGHAASGCLYVSDAADDALIREDILAVYTLGAAVERSDPGILVKAPTAHVFNFLQQLFDRYDAWSRKLDSLTMRQSGLSAILSAAREMLINPLTVLDEDFSPVMQSGAEALPPEQQMQNEDLDGPEAYNVLKTDIDYVRRCNDSAPILCESSRLGRLWSANIDGLSSRYRVLLQEGKNPLSPGDGVLLVHIVPHIRGALLRDRMTNTSDDKLRELLEQVLTDASTDYLELSGQFARLGWREEHTYFCLVLRLMRRENQGLSTQQICARLKRRYPQCSPLVHRGTIVCYFNATASEKSLDEVARELTVFIRDGLLNAGYSRPMQGLSFLKRQMIQAEAALEIGARRNPHKWIYHFDSISMEFLLQEAVHRLPRDMVCHPGLLALRAYDAENGTEYVRTLQVYLRQNLNAVRSARELFIHRSTFLYRLSRICELLGSTLEDPEELVYLSVSFMLLGDSQN